MACMVRCLNPSRHNPNLFMTLKKKPFENIEGNGENAGNQNFLLFPQRFLSYQKVIISLATFTLSSMNALNLVKSKMQSCDKGLTHSHTMTPFDAPGKQAF